MINIKLALNKTRLYVDTRNLSCTNLSALLQMTVCAVYITSRGQPPHCKWHFMKGHSVELQSGPAVNEAFTLSGNPQSQLVSRKKMEKRVLVEAAASKNLRLLTN